MQKIPAVTDEQFEACNEFNKMICEDFLANSTELARKSIGAYRSGLREHHCRYTKFAEESC